MPIKKQQSPSSDQYLSGCMAKSSACEVAGVRSVDAERRRARFDGFGSETVHRLSSLPSMAHGVTSGTGFAKLSALLKSGFWILKTQNLGFAFMLSKADSKMHD